MKNIKIEVSKDFTDVFVTCPHCDNCEQHPIDEQRHHLQTFDIIEWEEDKEDSNEFSIMSCCTCKKEFRLEWDYDN
jgi:hypothetical protein